ncbi:ATP-binding protein [Nostoc sp.]|uniref:ATP-binding protein n=1 Tax=Nostoc sp. TaxID=1180 RepID=UPI002FF5A88D
MFNNAYKYKPAGDKIVLTVRHNSSEASAKTIIITNSADISITELPRIFYKFYHLSNADIWNQGSFRLGLSIVQKLTEQLQGNI